MTTTGEPAVEVRGLRKIYGQRHAVDGIDLTVPYGQVFALLGPNGAGKTTTVEVLEGYRQRNAGDVRVLGHDPAHPNRSWRSRIGIVAQTTNDLSELTVAEVVRHFAGFYPAPRPPAEVIELVGLSDDATTRARALSGGRRRRLDVALGIVGAPELLFLDEPTTGFDPEARREFWTLVQDLAAHGTTILLTTHYLEEVEALADELAVIADGRIVATGTPEDLDGRASAPATVRWFEPGNGGEDGSDPAADGPISADPRRLRTEVTATPTAFAAQLRDRLGGEAPGLTITRPTLEDTYLRLLGDR